MTIRPKKFVVFLFSLIGIFLAALTYATYQLLGVAAIIPLIALIYWLIYIKKITVDARVTVAEGTFFVVVPRVRVDNALNTFSISFTQYSSKITDLVEAKIDRVKGKQSLILTDVRSITHVFPIDIFDQVQVHGIIERYLIKPHSTN